MMIGLMMFLLALVAAVWSSARLWQDRFLTGVQKGCLFLFFLTVWFFPILCRKVGFELPIVYTFPYHVVCFLFVWCFLFFVLHLVQDLIWGVFWLYDRWKARKVPFYWKRGVTIRRSNIILLSISLVLSLCALYNGLKAPELRELKIYTSKIDSNVTMVALSDLHLHHSLSMDRLDKIIDKVNAANPDVIVFLGDFADERTTNLHQQLFELSQLKAPYGKYAVAGNHEFFVGHEEAKETFKEADITYLFNEGVEVAPHLYIAGVPDYRGVRKISDSVDVLKALSSSQESDYKILLSHRPDFINTLVPKQIDLQLSGHTHGGQIFPQHLIVKFLNYYLSGLYQTPNGKLYVNRGAGQWGAQMRLFAPSEITVIRLIAEAKLLDNQTIAIEDAMYSDEAFLTFIQEEAAAAKAKQSVYESAEKAEKKAKQFDEPTPEEKPLLKPLIEKSADKVKSVVEETVEGVKNTLKELKEEKAPVAEKSVSDAGEPKILLLPIKDRKPIMSVEEARKKSEKPKREEALQKTETKEIVFNYDEIDALIASIQKEKQAEKEQKQTAPQKKADSQVKPILKETGVKKEPTKEVTAVKTPVQKEAFVRQENMYVEVSKGKDGKIYGVRIYNANHELIADSALKDGTNVLMHTEENADGSLVTHETVLHVRSTPNAQLIERQVNTVQKASAKDVKKAPEKAVQVQPVSYAQTIQPLPQRLMPVAAPIAWQPVYSIPEGGVMPVYQPLYYTVQPQ